MWGLPPAPQRVFLEPVDIGFGGIAPLSPRLAVFFDNMLRTDCRMSIAKKKICEPPKPTANRSEFWMALDNRREPFGVLVGGDQRVDRHDRGARNSREITSRARDPALDDASAVGREI